MSTKLIILNVIYHCQKPLDSTKCFCLGIQRRVAFCLNVAKHIQIGKQHIHFATLGNLLPYIAQLP
jgi:hypothetical protein